MGATSPLSLLPANSTTSQSTGPSSSTLTVMSSSPCRVRPDVVPYAGAPDPRPVHGHPLDDHHVVAQTSSRPAVVATTLGAVLRRGIIRRGCPRDAGPWA